MSLSAPTAWPVLRPGEAAEAEAPYGAVGAAGRASEVPGRVVWAVLGAGAVWLATVLALRWPVLTHPGFVSNSPIDAAFFTYAGDIVRRGGTPYLSFWDHKPPLVYFINAAALASSGGALWGPWLASLATLVGALLLGYLCTRRLFGAAPALLAAVFFAVAVQGILAVGLTEGFAPPLQWLAILAFVRWREGGSGLGAGFALGATAALLALLRQNLIAAPLAAGLVITMQMAREREGRSWLAVAAGAVAGAALVVLPVLWYLASRGALAAFRDQVLHYNSLYVAASWLRRLRTAYVGLRFTGVTAPLLLPLAGWLLTVVRLAHRPESRRRSALLLVVIWLPLELGLAALSGRSYAHYFMLLFAPLSLAVAAFGAELRAWGRAVSPRRSVPVLSAMGVALAVPAVLDLGLWVDGGGVPHRRADQLAAVTRWLETRTDPSAPIYVWGHAADVYYFSHRRPASHYIYPLPLLTPGYGTPARVDSFLVELRRAEPSVIVDATPNAKKSDALVPSLAAWDPSWRYPEYARRPYWSMMPAMRRVYDYVAVEYVPVAFVGRDRWVVYQRRDAVPAGTVPVDPRAAERTTPTDSASSAGDIR